MRHKKISGNCKRTPGEISPEPPSGLLRGLQSSSLAGHRINIGIPCRHVSAFRTLGSGSAATDGPWAGASLHTWDPLLAALSQSRELILVDLPGHGKSAPLSGRQTVEAHADALASFVQSQGLATADLAGSSVGGRLVLELSRRGIGRHCVALTRPKERR